MKTLPFLGLINNVALLVALGVLCDLISARRDLKKPLRQILAGLLMGGIGVAVMMNPWRVAEGIVFDTRSILLSVGALFFGPISAAFAAAMTGIFRFYLGGPGTLTGIGVIVTSTLVGILWRQMRKRVLAEIGIGELALLGLVVHLLMILWMITLPTPWNYEVIVKIWFPVMILYPIGTVLLGKLFAGQFARDEAARALERSEAEYRRIVDTANEGIWAMDENFRTTFANERMAEMLGEKPSEMLGKRVDSFMFEEDLTDHNEKMMSRQRGSDGRYERRFRHKDGDSVWTIVSAIALLDDEGRFKGSFAMLTDITERKRAEDALRGSEAMLKSILSTSPVGIGLAEGRIMKWANEAWMEMFGFANERELVGQSARVIYPSDAEYERAGVALYGNLGSGQVTAVDATLRRKDGSLFDGHIRMKALDSPGPAARTISVISDISEGRRAERVLRESEVRYRTLFDNAPVGIFQTSSEGQTLYVNPYMAKLVGAQSPEEAVIHFRQLSNQLYADSHRRDEFIRTLREEGQVTDFEYEAVRMDGSRRHFSMNARVSEFRPDGSFLIEGFTSDITEQKLAEEALRQSEERYRATFNSAAVGIDLVDLGGRFLKVNAVLSNYLGYTEEELRNLTIEEVTHPEDLEKTAQMHDALVRGNTEGYKLEKRYLRKDGSVIWADTYVSAIRDSGGKHVAAVGVILDTTKQRKLDEIRLRLATAVEQVVETIVITDTQGTIVYVNPAFERVTGYSREEAIGNNPRILRSGQHDERFYKNLWDTISSGAVWSGHFITRKKDGSLFEEEATISPIKDNSGNIVNYVAVKRDVTKELSLQKQLLQAQKMEAVGTLAGGIAHDFNNLLQVTLGFSELLLAPKNRDDPEYADLMKIFQAAKNGAELVQRLLTFSRKVEPKPIPLDLNRQIVQVENLLRRTIPKMIAIQLDLADDLARINADSAQVEQILMNLAVNARDAMPDGGKLTIATTDVSLDGKWCKAHVGSRPGEYVLLTVSDTGHGMDPKTVEHIFEPFYTTKELGRGTGLGLAMVYGIVKQHNGYIVCDSEIGRGTVFNVYFPPIEAYDDSSVEEPALVPTFGTETLLIVDDEELIRDLGHRILSKAGYKVIAARNGKEALTLFKKERPHVSLVILDLIMPEMGGLQCLRELLKMEPKLKVLVASGLSADSSIQEPIELGARGFVSKPFRGRELLRQVRKALDQD
jgi:two-component system, cell cycle sensor histidine kinase and response regulator CckA